MRSLFVLILHGYLLWRAFVAWLPLSSWKLITPQAATNLLLNPSVELALTPWVATGGTVTVTRSSEQAAFGGWSSKAVTTGGAANEGVGNALLAVAPSLRYVASAWVYGASGTVAIRLREADSGSATIGDTIGTATTLTDGWQRLEVARTFSASGVKAQLFVRTDGTQAITFYVDGLQLEVLTSGNATTYIDGDQPGGRWNGTRHASTSTRVAKYRGGGRIRDLEDDYNFIVSSHQGTGWHPVRNVISGNGILGGATYERTIDVERPFVLNGFFEPDDFQDLHDSRQALMAALAPNLVTPQQPVVLRYTGNTDGERDIYAHYEAGLEWTLSPDLAWYEEVSIRFLAADPFWYESGGMASKILSVNEDITDADYIIERAGDTGIWRALSLGRSATVRAAAYGPDGYLYVATGNNVDRWDGASWTTLKTFNNLVYALAFGGAGHLYVGGQFTDAAHQYIARYDGSTWTALSSATALDSTVSALAYNPADGYLYVGGAYQSVDGDTDGNRIARWDGANWAVLGSGTSGPVHALALDGRPGVYLAGIFATAWDGAGSTSAVTVNSITRWTGSAFVSLNSPLATTLGNEVFALAVGPNGILYAGGDFAAPILGLMQYNGTSWSALGSGVNGAVYGLGFDFHGRLIVGGPFTSAGGTTYRDNFATWNGSTWGTLLIDLPGTATVYAVAVNPSNGNQVFGYNTAGTAVGSNVSDTTVTNEGSADAYPLIRITGPGTVEGIENTTTGHKLEFDLTLREEEVLFIDLGTLTPAFYPTSHLDAQKVAAGPIVWSTFRGNAIHTLSAQSDITTWRLQPGLNTVLVKLSNNTAASEVVVMWRSRYLAID